MVTKLTRKSLMTDMRSAATEAKCEYDQWHRQLDDAGECESPLVHSWYASVYEELKKLSGGRLLEVGCGRGSFAIWLAGREPRFDIVAVDFSDTAIDIARERALRRGAKVKFDVADAEALPFGDDTFDIVISCECMEHVQHPRVMAGEISRVLRSGGRFCLTTPSQLNGMLIGWAHAWLTGRKFNSGAGVQPRENFYFFWTVKRYLRAAGLSVDRVESSTYQWLLLPRVAPAKLCTKQFTHSWARVLAFPFGLHFSYFGSKPTNKGG